MKKINIEDIYLNKLGKFLKYKNKVIFTDIDKDILTKIEKALLYMLEQKDNMDIEIKQGIFIIELYIFISYKEEDKIKSLFKNYIEDNILNNELDNNFKKFPVNLEKEMSAKYYSEEDKIYKNILEMYNLIFSYKESEIQDKENFRKDKILKLLKLIKKGEMNELLNFLSLKNIKISEIDDIIKLEKYIQNCSMGIKIANNLMKGNKT